ncbi:hypothetical protein [Absidia glauca]|uniref:Uncharacterized protein n=1 Tax=Absidia glauca TaxID=4829 RepID=A0A168NMA3_ABSGL|nr:hypothetical protein [Absidia glauca]
MSMARDQKGLFSKKRATNVKIVDSGVAPPVLEAGFEIAPPVVPDLFSSLLAIDQLFDWAMDPSVPSLGE